MRTPQEMDAIHADRTEMLGQIDGIYERAKRMQRDKALGQVGIRDIGDTSEVDWARIFQPSRERFENSAPLVIHIALVVPTREPAFCGTTKGRVGNPDTVSLLVDRWCSRCWNRWARRKAA